MLLVTPAAATFEGVQLGQVGLRAATLNSMCNGICR